MMSGLGMLLHAHLKTRIPNLELPKKSREEDQNMQDPLLEAEEGVRAIPVAIPPEPSAPAGYLPQPMIVQAPAPREPISHCCISILALTGTVTLLTIVCVGGYFLFMFLLSKIHQGSST